MHQEIKPDLSCISGVFFCCSCCSYDFATNLHLVLLSVLLSSVLPRALYSTCNTHKESSRCTPSGVVDQCLYCRCTTYQASALLHCATLCLLPTALQKPFVTVCTSYGRSTVKGHDHDCEGSNTNVALRCIASV